MNEQNQVHPLQGLKDQYDQLCNQRDESYARVQHLEDELESVNSQINTLLARSMELAKQIEEGWGPSHFSLKKQIAALARALSAPGGLLATKG